MRAWTVILLALAALIVPACSRPAQKANNTNAPAGKPAPLKKSYRAEYDRDMPAAFDAHKAWEASKTDDNYVDWTVKMHAALKWLNLHRKENGEDSTANWPKVRELKELRSGYWKNAKGPMDDPRVKAAITDWETSAN